MAEGGDEGFTWSWRPQTRRKLADDPLFDEGDDVIGDAVKHIVEPPESSEENSRGDGELFPCQIARCGLRFSSVGDYEIHYSNAHRNVCNACRRHFANTHLLDIHILETHNPLFASLAQKQKMFSCLVEMCSEKYPSAATRKRHLIDTHKYPSNFRFDTQHKESKKTLQKKGATESATQLDVVMGPAEAGDQRQSSLSASGRRFVYNVPKNICFGQGSQRGFARVRGGRGRGKKHWHQVNKTPAKSEVDIEEVDMGDLSAALEAS